MTTTEWAHLPNAKHIDRILAHVWQHHDRWGAAWDDDVASDAWVATWDMAYDAAWAAARSARTARTDAMVATWQSSPGGTWTAYRGATAALVAWDDCAHLLDQPVDAVRLLAACGHHPAVLLLPACTALTSKD
jgi:hypothetical protein